MLRIHLHEYGSCYRVLPHSKCDTRSMHPTSTPVHFNKSSKIHWGQWLQVKKIQATKPLCSPSSFRDFLRLYHLYSGSTWRGTHLGCQKAWYLRLTKEATWFIIIVWDDPTIHRPMGNLVPGFSCSPVTRCLNSSPRLRTGALVFGRPSASAPRTLFTNPRIDGRGGSWGVTLFQNQQYCNWFGKKSTPSTGFQLSFRATGYLPKKTLQGLAVQKSSSIC